MQTYAKDKQEMEFITGSYEIKGTKNCRKGEWGKSGENLKTLYRRKHLNPDSH